ncbi:MAG TPA: hypothetical protein VM077_06145 [Candidatus Limnocylindrales bacterium]|nr:hypothetical protein [Candidatus Limnocylindrales bacterium]
MDIIQTTQTTKKSYACSGSCHAEISQEQYDGGLTACGADVCTMKGQPFVEKITETTVVDKTDDDEDVIINN